MLDNQELDKAHFNAVPASEDQECVLMAHCTESLFKCWLKKQCVKMIICVVQRKNILLSQRIAVQLASLTSGLYVTCDHELRVKQSATATITA